MRAARWPSTVTTPPSFAEELTGFASPDGDLELTARLYRGVCLVCGIAVFLLILPLNALQDLPAVLNVGAGGFGAMALFLYALARRGRYYPAVLVIGVLVTLTVGWFPNAGSHGSVVYYFFPALGMPLALCAGRARAFFASLVILDALALMLIEFQFPELVRPYSSQQDRVLDLVGGLLVAFVTYALVMWVVFDGYRRERRRLVDAERATAESQASLSTLIDSTDDLVWMVDAEHFGLTLYNAALAARLTKTYGVTVAPGLSASDLFPPDHASEWNALYRRAIDEGAFTVEQAVAGTPWFLLLSISPVRHGPTAIGVSVFAKDITERKREQDARDRMEQQVLESQKLESLGRLAGGVAHDFNNMLGGIMGYADLMLEGEGDPQRRGYLDGILKAARRSAELTRKLLGFARRGKNIVEPVDLNAIVRDSVTMLKPSIQGSVRIVEALEATWLVDGDPSQLNQVVLNLCINANEAMSGGGALTVETSDVHVAGPEAGVHDLNAGAHVRLRVTDTGVGMTDDVRAHAFEPFFSTKGRAAGGTGLGLPTVYGIVRMHQGALNLESSPGQGTTITVWLPRGRAVLQTKPAVEATPMGRGRILVVEDEPMLREFTATALKRLGYQVVTAADGVEALRAFRANRGALKGVLLDLKMPNMGGRDAFIAMRDDRSDGARAHLLRVRRQRRGPKRHLPGGAWPAGQAVPPRRTGAHGVWVRLTARRPRRWSTM